MSSKLLVVADSTNAVIMQKFSFMYLQTYILMGRALVRELVAHVANKYS